MDAGKKIIAAGAVLGIGYMWLKGKKDTMLLPPNSSYNSNTPLAPGFDDPLMPGMDSTMNPQQQQDFNNVITTAQIVQQLTGHTLAEAQKVGRTLKLKVRVTMRNGHVAAKPLVGAINLEVVKNQITKSYIGA